MSGPNRSQAVMAQRKEPAETWRAVDGFAGYEVSNLGRVRSWKWPTLKRQWVADHRRPPRLLSACLRNGYPSVLLSDARIGRQWFSIHRLVLAAFVSPPRDGEHGAHRDGDRLNNRVENLRWATPVENNADKREHGTLGVGERIGSAKLTDHEAEAIRELRAEGWPVADLARAYGVHRNTISSLVAGRTYPPCRDRLFRPEDVAIGAIGSAP